MKRFVTSICILLGLLLLSVCSLVLLRRECRTYTALAEKTAAAYADGDTQAALEGFEQLETAWEHFHNVTGLFVDGGKLDAIYAHLIPLRPLLEQNCPEAAGELTGMILLTQGLYKEELPTLWHIL
jgi:hypothetical protein